MRRLKENIISLKKVFKKTNNETNKWEQNGSLNPKQFPKQFVLKGLPTNTVTKNPIFHNLN